MGHPIVVLFKQPLSETLQSGSFFLGFAVAYAWCSLGVMTGGWVNGEQVAWHWPVMGGLTGILCTALLAPFALLYLPCLLLGMYLCFVHLSGADQAQEEAT